MKNKKKDGKCLPCIERGEYKACFVNLEEGYCGDYDPDDPEDENLLRIDLEISTSEICPSEMKSAFLSLEHSACTSITVNAPDEHLKAVLEYAMDQLEKGVHPRHLIEEISWFDDKKAMELSKS